MKHYDNYYSSLKQNLKVHATFFVRKPPHTSPNNTPNTTLNERHFTPLLIDTENHSSRAKLMSDSNHLPDAALFVPVNTPVSNFPVVLGLGVVVPGACPVL